MASSKIIEGVFAIDKPKSITSAQLLREIQKIFNSSRLFRHWLDAENRKRQHESSFQRRRHRGRNVQVKLGHGGTLDPLATGVLIVGVGRGTKYLQDFLDCTKCYDATLLLGAATDTYDITGRVIGRSTTVNVSRAQVEAALEAFKGHIMQRPPVYSALRVQGKRLYEYAREGKEIPVEVKERAVTVENIAITEWLDSNSHQLMLPSQDAEKDEIKVAEYVVGHVGSGHTRGTSPSRPESEPRLLCAESNGVCGQGETVSAPSGMPFGSRRTNSDASGHVPNSPAIKLRMTVGSGFYVRSLCHDLGQAVGSLGVMGALRRVRQGKFELGKNVFAYDDFERGEDVWAPKLLAMLEDWENGQKPQSSVT